MKIMLIDGNSILFRAFYALPLLSTRDGEYTNALLGFLNIFFKLYDQEGPDYLAVAFDLPHPTFRHKKYENYKGTRKPMPEELKPQIGLLKSLLNKMNIPVFELAGFEADDVLGSLAMQADANGMEVTIVSGDRDLLQLAGERIKIRIPKTKAGKTEVEDYYAKDVKQQMGVSPSEYIDVKALMGDVSDNIPGIPGIGEKTAFKIIQEYKSIESAIAHAEEVKPKRASQALVTYREQGLLSKELATIDVNAPVSLNVGELTCCSFYNEESLNEICRLEFKSYIQRFSAPDTEMAIQQLKNHTEIKNFLATLDITKPLAFHFIFTKDELTGLALAQEPKHNVYIRGEELVPLALTPEFLKMPKITFDAKTAIVYWERKGIVLENIIFDAMLAAYVLDANKGSYSIKDIAWDYLSENCPHDIQCDVLLRAYPVMDDKLRQNNQEKLYYDIEHPLMEVLKDMELCGITTNAHSLQEYGLELDILLQELTQNIYTMAGKEFNINSPMQMADILFGEENLNLKGTKKTKQGYSTAADVLEKLKSKHPIIPEILAYRTYAKLKSTYVSGLLAVLQDGKIYSTFHQAITSTGRLSSSDPNLQNIPIRLEVGRRLRKAFVPEEGFVFLDGDYSQIELRVLAAMSSDEAFINAFKENQDIHKMTASQVFNTPYEMVTAKQRTNAKAVNFGIVYGISAFSLSQDLGITKKEAESYMQNYFAKYPGVKKYLDDSIKNAKENGYAQTLFNRRRLIPELLSSNFNVRSFGERVAMNMPIQGTAADIIKIAMIRVHKRLKSEMLKSRLILQVHDELLLEVYAPEQDIARKILKEEMEAAVELSVPIVTDVHFGDTWYDVH